MYKMESDSDSKNKLIDGLRQAAKGEARSKTARLREIYDEIEAAKAAGLSLKAIVDVLRERGLEFDLDTFVNIRQRIKNERKGEQKTKQTSIAQTATAITSATAELNENSRQMPVTKSNERNGTNKTHVTAPEKLREIINGKLDLTKFRNNND